jgi:hypothetical protein
VSAELDEVPAAVGEAGLLGDAKGGGVAVAVEVDGHGPVAQDLLGGLGDEHAGETLAAVGGLGADGDLVAELVVLLAADAGGVAAVIVPGDEDLVVEGAEPSGEAGIVVRDPLADFPETARPKCISGRPTSSGSVM